MSSPDRSFYSSAGPRQTLANPLGRFLPREDQLAHPPRLGVEGEQTQVLVEQEWQPHGTSSALPSSNPKGRSVWDCSGPGPSSSSLPKAPWAGRGKLAVCVSAPRAKSIPTVATREASSSPGLLGGVVLKNGGGCSCLLHRSPVQGTRSWPPRVPDGAMVSNAAASLDAAAAAAGGSPGQRPGFNSHPGTGPRVAR